MYSSDSIFYPVVIVSVVSVLMILVRIFFKNKITVNDEFNIGGLESNDPYHASYVPGRALPVLFLLLVSSSWVVWQVWSVVNDYASTFRPFYIAFGIFFLLQLLLASLKKPYQNDGPVPDKELHTSVVVPVYNENPDSLEECLKSIFQQDKKPNEIHVVDDGSSVSYSDIKKVVFTGIKKVKD